MKWKISSGHDGMLIKEYLQQIQGFSRRILKAVKFDGGTILQNGKPATVRKKLTAGDRLQVIFPPEQRGNHMQAANVPLHLIYEDDDVLVLDKPAGIASIPSHQHPSSTIANGLINYYEKKQLAYTVHIVTRLDKDTSGLMLVAKHRFSHSRLSDQQKQGCIKRSYSAFVEGKMEQKAGTINAAIGRKHGSIIEREVTEHGQQAITHYQVIEELDGYSLVDIQLETGRTHQIRVHFSYIGHPLIGDDLYGGNSSRIARQALHCKTLAFSHPASGERLEFTAEMPKDMTSLRKC
ncbi:RluA family pseudouridine synthase [Sediminibacillus albus]|uniref:Pseudouridine synthase n=1 Tax=Sediminibacillus albus TaxID=407036 RepID=A0A1G8X834_9BACI|nr:RluA family pseudouridine synthase [Sediminibacillus albus]SDJ86762.1 23S rRNA pseudouridine1911/1915/1917 synthase [Sediminibacillus albus]